MSTDARGQQRQRVILAAFQTGRSVFGDSEGVLRYTDGDREELAADVGLTKQPVPQESYH